MQKLLCILFLGMALFSYGQKTEELEPFEAITTELGATLHIVKSKEHKIAITGDAKVLPYVRFEVDESNLKIKAEELNRNYSDVQITIYTPRVQALAMSNGGVVTMDSDFSTIATLVVSVEDESLADLSNIDFKTLVTSSDKPDRVLYKSAQTVVSSYNHGKSVALKN